MTGTEVSNSRAIAQYVSQSSSRNVPQEALDIARFCLVDWVGVCVGAKDEGAANTVRNTAMSWSSGGRSTVMLGGSATAAVAALCNGTLAHCLDFDDTYMQANAHLSAPLWAATLALGQEVGANEMEMLKAFVTGFETAAQVGFNIGEAVTSHGFHGTGVFGVLGASASCSALLRLSADVAQHALGTAATQVGGLVGSFGTMAKPFHAGKAAMDGVLSAQLAISGFEAATELFEPGGALDSTIIQDRSSIIRRADFSSWEILNNSFKGFAACHLTHAAVEAAQSVELTPRQFGMLCSITAEVCNLALQVTGGKGGDPNSGLEAKFDIKFCIALALHGREVGASDFREPFGRDPKIISTAEKVNLISRADLELHSSRLTLRFLDGTSLIADVRVGKGHPFNPMDWEDMWNKFDGLVYPVLGTDTASAFDGLRHFGTGSGGMDALTRVVSGIQGGNNPH